MTFPGGDIYTCKPIIKSDKSSPCKYYDTAVQIVCNAVIIRQQHWTEVI